jgi:23S rRNA (uridine2552-2'-O)-methyltransferase
MARSRSSHGWMREHVSDPFVRKARAHGYRSRAAFKLLEMIERDKLVRPGMVVVELGAAPGGWSQVLAQRLGPRGKLIAVDLLEMDPIGGAQLIQGDFREEATLREVESALPAGRADLVVSDMAPNISGVASTDQARSQHLVELAIDFAFSHLQPGGALLVKAFHGSGIEELRKKMREAFAVVQVRKPKASRDRSSEFYLLGTGFSDPARP